MRRDRRIRRAYFWRVPDFVAMLRELPEPERTATFNAAMNADLLVLDDLGAEHVTGWMLEWLYRLVSNRYEAPLTTIYTTNVESEELNNHLDDRITDRVQGMCFENDFRCDQPSLRLRRWS